jgi:hypothetical protein
MLPTVKSDGTNSYHWAVKGYNMTRVKSLPEMVGYIFLSECECFLYRGYSQIIFVWK